MSDPRFQPVRMDFPALVVPVAPASPGLPWRAVTPVPTPPPSAVPILDVTRRLREHTRLLREANRSSVRCRQDVAAWAGSIRALRGLAQLMAESHRSTAPGAPHEDVERFAQRARELHEALCGALDLTDPLPQTHPGVVRSVRGHANDILDIFRNGEHVEAVRALREDPTVSDPWKYGYLTKLHEWIGKACRQVERTPAQAQLEDEIHAGITTEDDNLIAAARSALTLGELEVALPALALLVKEANLAILGVYARRRFAELARAPERCRSCARELVDDFLRLTDLERERAIVEQAVGSGSRDDMLAAQERIAGSLRGGPLLASAMAVLSYAAGFVVLADRPGADAGVEEGLIWGLNVTGAAIDAVGATVTVATRAGALIELRQVGLRRALQQMSHVVQAAEAASSCVTVVISIFEGVHDITTGLEEGDEVTVTVGSLRVLSGSAIALGLLFGIETMNPVGIGLGLTAAAIAALHERREQGVPYNQRLCEQMIQYITAHPGSERFGHPIRYLQLLGLEPRMNDLIAAAERSDWWGVRHPPPAPAAGTGAAFDDAVRARLRAYGLPRGRINAILGSEGSGGPLLRGFDADG